MDRVLIKSLPFEIDARVPIQLGRESISSSVVAISELVKNAYDADAENVKIHFFNLGSKKSTLVIEDNGDGMNLELLTNYWLRIGTDYKTNNIHSNSKRRVLTGAKGLGRLGIDRLCHKLILQTKQFGMDYVLEIQVDWEKYEKEGKALSDILHDIYRVSLGFKGEYGISYDKIDSKGTRLIMQGLKDYWMEEFLADLKQELSLLISPFGGINDFRIDFKSGISSLDGELSSTRMLGAAEWILEAELDEDELVTIKIRSEQSNENYTDGPHKWAEWLKDRGKHPECGPFRFVMYFIPRDLHILKQLDFDRDDWAQFMKANQGIRIYRDNFRVRPYGEPSGKGDWLDLGLRRSRRPEAITQSGWKIGPHQSLGAVFIGRETNPNLIDQTNREGIVESTGFFELRAALLR